MARAVAMIVAGCLALASLEAQSRPGGTPAFEVASIKPNPTGTVVLPDGRAAGGSNIASYNGRFTAQNVGVRTLVYLSYGVQEFQVSGGPRWILSERFDVDAKADTAVDEGTLLLMMRSLLAERFGLVLRREMRELPAHVLVVANKGPRLTPAATEVSTKGFRFALLDVNEGKGQRMRLSGTGSLADLTSTLSRAMRMPIVDGTGLTGLFDVSLDWTSETFAMRIKGSERGAMTGAPLDFPAMDPALNEAFHAELGLEFETRKAPVEMFIIDDAKPPSAN